MLGQALWTCTWQRATPSILYITVLQDMSEEDKVNTDIWEAFGSDEDNDSVDEKVDLKNDIINRTGEHHITSHNTTSSAACEAALFWPNRFFTLIRPLPFHNDTLLLSPATTQLRS